MNHGVLCQIDTGFIPEKKCKKTKTKTLSTKAVPLVTTSTRNDRNAHMHMYIYAYILGATRASGLAVEPHFEIRVRNQHGWHGRRYAEALPGPCRALANLEAPPRCHESFSFAKTRNSASSRIAEAQLCTFPQMYTCAVVLSVKCLLHSGMQTRARHCRAERHPL